MGRPKKEKPNHGNLFEVKITIGHKLNGDAIRKSFYSSTSKDDSREQAKQWIIEKEVSERTGETFIEKDMTFGEWAKKWMEIYKRPNVDENTYYLTYEQNVNNHLIPYFKKANIKEIRPIDIQKFFDSKSHFSDSVLKKLHMCLNGIFESAIENDVCRKNPVRHISVKSKRKRNVKHVYTDEQIKSVKNYCKLKMPEVSVILDSGIRRGELLGLKWLDFDKKKKCISINRAIADVQSKIDRNKIKKIIAPGIKENPPKWNSYRTIPINDDCVTLIDSLPRNGEYIFPSKNGKPQGPNNWSQKLKRFMKKMNAENLDIPILSAHELRHTFGTMLRRRDVDIYTIQKVMGHKDIKMTSEIYVHNEIETLRNGLKLGTDVVQVSYGRKYHIKKKNKKSPQNTESL